MRVSTPEGINNQQCDMELLDPMWLVKESF